MSTPVEPIDNYALKVAAKPSKTTSGAFKKVGIVGCGILGQEITRMVSGNGIEVRFIEISQEKIDQALREIARELDRMIQRWGMTESEKRAILSRIKGATNYQLLEGCDIVIEAVKSRSREDSVELRKKIFREIENHTSESCLICTNSTTLVITELSSELKRPDRCVSIHFLSPADTAEVVEIARGLNTSDETYERVCKFARMFGKKVIPVVESPGVISTRLIAPIINEACEILMEGVGSLENIDLTMKLGFGFPLGPFEIADKIGLDTVVRWLENMYKEYGDLKYKASPLLKKMVRANHLGRDTGIGFYKYDSEGRKIVKS